MALFTAMASIADTVTLPPTFFQFHDSQDNNPPSAFMANIPVEEHVVPSETASVRRSFPTPTLPHDTLIAAAKEFTCNTKAFQADEESEDPEEACGRLPHVQEAETAQKYAMNTPIITVRSNPMPNIAPSAILEKIGCLLIVSKELIIKVGQ